MVDRNAINLNGEILYALAETRVLIERWPRHYNEVKPHGALGYQPPAPAAVVLASAASGYATRGLRPTRPRADDAVQPT